MLKTLFNKNKDNDLINKRMLLNWYEKSEGQKIRLLKKICNKIFRTVNIEFSNNIPFYVNGYFDYNKGNEIIINKDLLNRKTGVNAYAIIIHEYNHYLQYNNYLTKNGYERIYLSNTTHIKTFSNNQLYLTISNKYNKNIKNKMVLLNQLCRYERESSFKEYNKAISIDYSYPFPLKNSIEMYKDIYCKKQLSKEIFSTIDQCYENIYFNKVPANDLEATIMYDICVMSLFQAENISEIQFLEYMNNKNKARILEENQYQLYTDLDKFIPSNSLEHLCKEVREKDYILGEIKKMNEIQIKNNPKLMILAKHYYPKEIKEILENKNAKNIESEKELC